MYAILAHGGRQHRVTAGDRIVVDRLDAEPGTIVHLQPVLFTADGGKTALGKDVDGVRVAASVVQHLRGEKIRVFKYRAKKRTRRTMGHRSDLTELIVEGILARGEEHTGAPRAARTARKPATGRGTSKRAPARSRTATPRSRPAKPASVRATAAKRAPAKAKPATAGAGSKKAAASSAPTAKRQAAAKATTRKAPAKAAAKPTAAGSAAKAKPASKAQPAANAKPAAKRTGTGAKRSSTRRSGDGA